MNAPLAQFVTALAELSVLRTLLATQSLCVSNLS